MSRQTYYIATFRISAQNVKLVLPLLEGECELVSLTAEAPTPSPPSFSPPKPKFRQHRHTPRGRKDGLTGAKLLDQFLDGKPVGFQFEGTRVGKLFEQNGFDAHTASSILSKTTRAGRFKRVQQGLYEVLK